MNLTRLFIEGHEIELNELVEFAITKQFEDITNPTTIINDWSKTVLIPFSQNNNKVFGDIYKVDRLISYKDDEDLVGLYFDPYKKLDFRLEWNGFVVMTGYAKLNTVDKSNGKGTYNITLNGLLGKIFQEMKKITFDTTSDDSTYIINGSTYVDDYINRTLVANSWNTDGQATLNIDDPSITITDIIGFAPNNAYNDGFDYATFQYGQSQSALFTDTLAADFQEKTGVEPDTAIPNGLLPREIGEYRSYLQLPYIYFNKLFLIFLKKAESVTGYKFDLDSTWFNESNPYWSKLVYMLKSFNTEDGDTYNNYYSTTIPALTWTTGTSDIKYDTTKTVTPTINESGSYEQQSIYDYTYKRFNLSEDGDGIVCNIPINFNLLLSDGGWSEYYKFGNKNGLVITFNVIGYTAAKSYSVLIVSDETVVEYSEDDYYKVIKIDRSSGVHVDPYFKWEISYVQPIFMNYHTFGAHTRFTISASWLNNEDVAEHAGTSFRAGYVSASFTNPIVDTSYTKNILRSDARFTLNDLWNNDYNVFTEILKYCKMYRILITTDEYSKTLKFQQAKNYFSKYTVKDWTDKVDLSQDYTITPITLEDKYVLFNYKDNETELGQAYKEKYGLNHGEYRIITDYNFNTETDDLFEDIPTSITNTDNVLSWTNIYDNKKIIYSFPNEIYVYSKDSDSKYVDTFGQYYFYNGLKTFDTEKFLNMKEVYVSDDTELQQGNNTYFYSQQGTTTNRVYTYPYLDIYTNDSSLYLCLFNTPMLNYTYLSHDSNNNIYDLIWKNYIEERYNVQNKQVTCYLKLTPLDYIGFDFNHLIIIENQLYMINKIYDYDITGTGSTKVDLITIQDINGYTKNNL